MAQVSSIATGEAATRWIVRVGDTVRASNAGACSFEGAPGVLIYLAVDHALHQPDDRTGDGTLVAHRRVTVTFGRRARLMRSLLAGSA